VDVESQNAVSSGTWVLMTRQVMILLLVNRLEKTPISTFKTEPRFVRLYSLLKLSTDQHSAVKNFLKKPDLAAV
jgi:hypothetical protein